MQISDLDIIELLEKRGIEHWTSGKNTSRGWVNIQCPFCDDHSNHCGINIESKKFNCHKCHEKGFINRLLARVEGLSIAEANTIISQHIHPGYLPKVVKERSSKIEFHFPIGTKDFLPKAHKKYLRNRGFDPDFLLKEYHLKATGKMAYYELKNEGEKDFLDFSYRIIIPYFDHGKTVNFIARDITGRQSSKAKQCPNEISEKNKDQVLYNIDRGGRNRILVEGAFDVFRIGRGAVGLGGTSMTTGQLKSLLERDIKRVFILLDPGENEGQQAEKIAAKIAPFLEVEILDLGPDETRDPAEFTNSEALHLRSELMLD